MEDINGNHSGLGDEYSSSNGGIDSVCDIIQLQSSIDGPISIFNSLKTAFAKEPNIRIIISKCNNCSTSIVHLSPVPHDRSCLLPPPMPPVRIQTTYNGPIGLMEIMTFINSKTNSFRTPGGDISPLGRWIYKTASSLTNASSEAVCARIHHSELTSDVFLSSFWFRQRPLIIEGFPLPTTSTGTTTSLDKDKDVLEVLQSYLDEEVGVKWSPSEEFEGVDLLHNWEGRGEGEGNGQGMGMGHVQFVPEAVLRQLQSPDRVVVRAAHAEMRLGALLDLLREGCGQHSSTSAFTLANHSHSHRTLSGGRPVRRRTTAYLEYMSLRSRLPGLREQSGTWRAFEQWMDSLSLSASLRGGEPYLWLGDGNTVGRLHFDPFDNLLLQLEGSKTFTLTDPQNNERLYEGHMREAQIELNNDDNNGSGMCPKLQSTRLRDSTSMVHSPVRLHVSSDLKDFPLAAAVETMTCTVHPGQVLFVPSYWWHEVQSSPGTPRPIPSPSPSAGSTKEYNKRPRTRRTGTMSQSLNVALNMWYEPLFEKEFPCAHCRKRFNGKYRDVAQRLLDEGRLRDL
eukprot:gene7664-15684_t